MSYRFDSGHSHQYLYKMKTAITENDVEHINKWFDPEYKKELSIDEFTKYLDQSYEHDYGTVCKAIAAIALRSVRTANVTMEQGGITGFQATAVMWEFVSNFMQYKGPMKLARFENMLYPQYADSFDKVISQDTWDWLQEEANKMIIKNNKEGITVNKFVMAHWISISLGKVPFGYTVKD
jgi:hypothetical protein